MLEIALPIAIGMFALALLLSAWRLLRGPDLTDRVLALDTLYINALALVVIWGIGFDTQINFEVALVIAMLGFVGTVVMARYIAGGRSVG